MQEIVVPARADLTLRGATFKEPVLIDLLSGEVYPVAVDSTAVEGTEAGLRVVDMPLADYPFALVERAHIELL
jgi:hypothetical protein